MFLSALLLAFSITCFASESEIQLQILKNAQEEKALELSDLSEKISAQEVIIDALTSGGLAIYLKVINSLHGKTKEDFISKVEDFDEFLDRSFTIEVDIKRFIEQDLFNDRKYSDEIVRIKSSLMRRRVEYYHLKALIKRYEECLQELILIVYKLNAIQK